MSDDITRHDYWTEVRRFAKSIWDDALGYWLESNEPDQQDFEQSEDLSQYLSESIDGHSWVIYTWKAMQVLVWSENSDYSFQNFGPESCFDRETGIRWSSLACGAMYGDVQEHMHACQDDWWAERFPESD